MFEQCRGLENGREFDVFGLFTIEKKQVFQRPTIHKWMKIDSVSNKRIHNWSLHTLSFCISVDRVPLGLIPALRWKLTFFGNGKLDPTFIFCDCFVIAKSICRATKVQHRFHAQRKVVIVIDHTRV